MKNMMRYNDYYAIINYEDETATFWGKIEGIQDLISFESDSVQGLKNEFKKAVEEYLELCKKYNKEPQKQYKGSFNIRIKPEVHKKADMLAKTYNISLNQFVERAIEEKIKGIKL